MGIGSIFTFVAQWVLVLQILWVSCVLIPFTILAVAFFILNWLILDPFTNFLVSGEFSNNIVNTNITLQSPIVILTITGLVLALIALIVFIINFFSRNITTFQTNLIPKQFLLIFGFIGLIIVIPFGIILFSVFTKLLTSITLSLFTTTVNNGDLLDLAKFKEVLTNLLQFSNNSTIDKVLWDDAWKNVTDANQLAIKDLLFNDYNSLINSLNEINVGGLNLNQFIEELITNITNNSKLKEILTFNSNLTNDLTNIILKAETLKAQLTNLNTVGIDSNILETIKLSLGNFSESANVTDFLNNWSELIRYQVLFKGLNLSNSGEIANSNNLAFMLYYATTGIYVNSIGGIIANFSFVSGLFQSNGIFELIKAITLSVIVAGGITKAIAMLINMLVYRWFVLLASIPTGYLAAARITNDSGSILKIWFREILSSTLSLFIIVLNLQITFFLINAVQLGLISGSIKIDGIENVNLGLIVVNVIQITFALFTVVLMYVNNGFITKTLETFNASATFKDNASSSIINEYGSYKSNKTTAKKRGASTKKAIKDNPRLKFLSDNGMSVKNFKTAFGKNFKPDPNKGIRDAVRDGVKEGMGK